MRIDKIKINGFGKIKDKEIELKDGINILYGENESGKSTLLKFIQAFFYGIAKTKHGKNISDFEKYKPWEEADFSGKICYTLDNGEKYEVFRDFRKKNPVIYQAQEDISKNFEMDKTKGIPFLEQQVGIDENSFCHTAIIGQQEVRLEKADTNSIIQKISNLISSGDDTISFKKSMDCLNKLQNERIGTERTREKPMNIVDNHIKNLENEKSKLQKEQENFLNHAMEKEKIGQELKAWQVKKEEMKEARQRHNEKEIKKIETKLKTRNLIFLAILLACITVVIYFALDNRFIAFIPAFMLVMDSFMIGKTKQKAKRENSTLEISKVDNQMEKIEAKITDLKLKSHILDKEKADFDEKLEKLTQIEEQLEEQKRIKEELVSLDISYKIAKECLERAYDEIKHNLSPKFEEKLCEITASITDGKYKNVKVNDENGLYIEVENGAYMPVDRLSVGTMDEMYLALRLSVLSEMAKENLPILLDETFAYFDNQRLRNILCYLQDQNYNHQIILFTCTDREERVLRELKIEYHLISLEK